MDLILSTTETRTLVPVTVLVRQSSGSVSVVVSKINGNENFILNLNSRPEGSQGEFWLEQAGDYKVVGQDQRETQTRILRVREQVFLPFYQEFGLFLGVLGLAALGVFLWLRNKKKDGCIS